MSRFKKIIVSAIAGMVFFATVNVNALAQASTDTKSQPSHWAEEEISEAIAKGLVPEELQTNYQSNIKRYEYVLLALKVFDKTGKQVNTENEKPFNDVLNHKYEQEIVRAYNAGIIKGDGKGNFFPDNYITRQEIASLVVNLLMRISPEKDFSVKNSYEYSDESEISDWAKYYIDYCFENKILTGYGNNVIDPKGNATIEQSIALLYRLAKNEAH
ncbi:S-layer homology domain-containing protein [Thermoclostridium stercorarium]|uniref:S-layer homology domain-containing protein n=1 Tax=Thermoclostridium stercorarium TaxID=1510 RepID=UPI000B123A40|nr:S-layer homology domain-containing protein [Thermoclostridium stercorarium]